MKLLPLFLLVVDTTINAKVPSDALDTYDCPSRDEAYQCAKCKLDADLKVLPLINVTAQKVILNVYLSDGTEGQEGLVKCDVIDRKNWICGEGEVGGEPINGPAASVIPRNYEKAGMQNGRFYMLKESGWSRIDANNKISSGLHSKSYLCAK